MGKLLKRFLVILIVLIVAVLAMPKSEKAFVVSDDMIISGNLYKAPLSEEIWHDYRAEMRTLRNNWESFRIFIHTAMIFNKFVFCIEENQGLPPTDGSGNKWFECTWKVTIEDNIVYQQKKGGSRTELTGNEANFTRGLAYILSNMENFRNLDDGHIDQDSVTFNESDANYWKKVKPYQREIWSYLSQADVSSSKYWFGTGLSGNKWHSELSNSQMQIVNDALKIARGESNINIKEAEFYVLQAEDRYDQKLIVVKKSEEGEDPKLNFNFTKKDPNGNTLTGATVEIKVSGSKNADKTYENTTGYFELNEISPVYNSGTNSFSAITITIQETTALSGYVKDSTIYKYVIKYNSSTKKWYIDSSNTTTNGPIQLFSGTLSGDTLTTSLINKKEDPKLNFNFTKKNGKDNSTLTGATVKITVSGSKNTDKTYENTTGYFELNEISPVYNSGTNSFSDITITIQETAALSGYVKDSTIYKYVIKYNSSTEKWYIDSSSSNTKTNGSVQLFNGTLSENTLTTSLINKKEDPKLNFNFTKKSGKDNSTLSGATVDIKVSGTKNQDSTYGSSVYTSGVFSIKDMELANSNGSIEIIIEEKFAPSGYVKDSTIYKYVIKYNSSTEKWYIDSSSSKTNTNGSVQLLGNTLSGNTLSTWLVNKPDRPHNPGPGSSSDKDTWAKEPTTVTGKVWVEEQDGDKDIKINKSANNKFNNGIDTPLGGVDVNLNAKAVQYQPVYGYRYYKYILKDFGSYDSSGKWISDWQWDYNSTVYSDNQITNRYTSNTEFRDEAKLIRDYVAISSKTINEAVTTNGIGEYSFSTDLTTYEWTYNGTSHLISEYIEKDGTVTFKYNGVSYIQTVPAVSYTQNTSSDIYSNATESGRVTFNNKFKTVNLNNTIAAGAYADFSGGKSVLNIPVNGVKGGNAAYQIPASTSLNQIGNSTAKVSAKTYRVNLGLLTREIDVSLSTRGR